MKKIMSFVIAFIFLWTTSVHATTGGEDSSMISLEMHLTPLLDKVDIELVAKNQSDHDIQLQFPTSKIYDFSVYNTKNKEVYRFSDKRFFLQALQNITLKKDGEKVWKTSWDYTDHGKKLEEGAFIIKAVILPSKINGKPVMKRFTAEQEFFIPIVVDLKTEIENSQLIVTGKMKQASNHYYFTVDDGHHLIVSEMPLVFLNQTKEFKITFKKPNSVKGPLLLTIYNNYREPVFVENLTKK